MKTPTGQHKAAILDKKQAEKERLAKALRDNLKRRKAAGSKEPS